MTTNEPSNESQESGQSQSQIQTTTARKPDRESIGRTLRESRLTRGETIEDVAQHLRIRVPFLQAMEENRFGDLPGSAYSLGFLRSYAAYLGLDTEAVVERFKVEKGGVEEKAELIFPEPLPTTKIPGTALVLLGIVLTGLFYGSWWYVSKQEKAAVDPILSPPPDMAPIIQQSSTQTSFEPEAADTPLPSEQKGLAVEEDEAQTAGAAPAEPMAALPPPVEEVAEEAAAVEQNHTEPEAQTSPPQTIPRIFTTDEEKTRIVILAVASVWMEVSAPDGTVLFTGLLNAGDRYHVPNQEGLLLLTGNAGGLEILVDGTKVPAIGPSGAVRRGVELEPEALKSGTAVPKKRLSAPPPQPNKEDKGKQAGQAEPASAPIESNLESNEDVITPVETEAIEAVTEIEEKSGASPSPTISEATDSRSDAGEEEDKTAPSDPSG